MIADLLKDQEFQRLEKEFGFLRRAREKYYELENHPFVIVDIETTGLDPAQSEILEIGALKVEKQEIKGVFNKLICPESPIPPEITQINGLSQEEVCGYPKADKILPQFLKFIGNTPLVAHNSEFDIGFLKYHIEQKLNRDLDNFAICTLKLGRMLLSNLDNHKLHTIADYFAIPISNRHRALGDAEITYQVWYKFIKLLKDRNIVKIDQLYELHNRDLKANPASG